MNPSKVINEQFTLSTFSFKDGTQVTGRVINMVGDTYIVALNLMDIADEKRFFKKDVVSTEVSPISFMPEGLLNTLSEEDVLDLLAYLRSRETGDAQP